MLLLAELLIFIGWVPALPTLSLSAAQDQGCKTLNTRVAGRQPTSPPTTCLFLVLVPLGFTTPSGPRNKAVPAQPTTLGFQRREKD